MNLKRHLMLMLAVAITVTISEGSLVRRSLLRPEDREPCFTCRAEDRPFAYPLIAQFVKLKDMAVRVFKSIVASAKEQLN